MKILLVILLFASNLCSAAPVSFTWRANTESDLAGYKLYYGPASGNYTNNIRLGLATNYTMQVVGKQYFALSAFNNAVPAQESGLSSELVYNPPVIPTGFNFSLLLISEETCDFVLWEPFLTNAVVAAEGLTFYRLRAERP